MKTQLPALQLFTPPHWVKTLLFAAIMLAISIQANANNCNSADTIYADGGLKLATATGSEHWFVFTNLKNVNSLFATWHNGHAPTNIEIYNGNCSGLNLLYTSLFDTVLDTTNRFVVSLVPNTYYVKIKTYNGVQLGLALGIEALDMLCPSPGCNLVPNFSFENHPAFPASGKVPWGAFGNWANCWANGSSHTNTTPDYAIEPEPSCFGPGNQCKNPVFDFETWPNNNTEHATAHIFVYHNNPNNTATNNRREYILTELQDANGLAQLNPNRTYYVSLRVRNNPLVAFYNDALGIMFTDQLFLEPTTGRYIPPIGINLLYQSLTGIFPYNNTNWRQINTMVMNDAIPKSYLVIGNFENNLITAGQNIAGNPPMTNAQPFASIFIDHVEVLEMPDAGDNITVCEGEQVILGYSPACLPAGVTYIWRDALWTTVLGTSPSLTLNAALGTNTYYLQVTYEGQSMISVVEVTALPGAHLSVIPINLTRCNGDLEFEIQNYKPLKFNYDIDLDGMVGTANIDPQGFVVISGIEIFNPLGMATVTIISTNTLSECQIMQTFTVYDCCEDNPTGIPVYNDLFSKYNQGTQGQNYIIYGSVLLDDNYYFEDCNFYLQADAELEAMTDLNIEFRNCTFQSCTDFKWDRIYNPHPSTSLIFTDCIIGEGLRAIHTINDGQISLNSCTLTDNTLSQLVIGNTNVNALTWQSNVFNLYPLDLYTRQHPLSTIPISTILYKDGFDVVAIKFDECQAFNLNNANLFWSESQSTIYDHYLHVWIVQSSVGEINDNTFNEGKNIAIEQYSTVSIEGNTFEKSSQTYGHPGGIYAHNSTVTIGDLNATPFSNYLLDKAGITIENPVETNIFKNKILASDAAVGIFVEANPPSSSRTLIQENWISARTGILINNIQSWPNVANSNQRVFINDNNISTNSAHNATYLDLELYGITANSSPGIVIGNNKIYCGDVMTKNASPNALNNDMAIGIRLSNSPNSIVGTNEIHYFGRGLHLEGDATGNSTYFPDNDQYFCNEFASCYHGIYLEVGGAYNDFGKIAYGVDNIWTTSSLPINNPFSVSHRVFDGRLSVNSVKYHHSGTISSNLYPSSNSIYILNSFGTANSCTNPPTNKNEETTVSDAFLNNFIVYPNPTRNYITIQSLTEIESYKIQVFTITGLLKSIDIQKTTEAVVIDVTRWNKGVYILKITSSKLTEEHRIVVL